MTHAVGVVGLGVMGRNLARNIAGKGFPVAGYDLDAAKRTDLSRAVTGGITTFDAPDALAAALERPRRILMMVPAGPAVDEVVRHLQPSLERGDILVDGGNSYFRDTDRRCAELEASGVQFVGAGVSGGEEGALRGPAIMVGGSVDAWNSLAAMLRSIAARAGDGSPCVARMGPRGAGHYVKMVHNGIEYGDMQLIAEAYDVLSRGLGMTAPEIGDVFAKWNEGPLASFLVELTAKVLMVKDDFTTTRRRDSRRSATKGTGKWMSQDALDLASRRRRSMPRSKPGCCRRLRRNASPPVRS